TRVQGVPPQRLVVVTGDREEHAWAPRDVQAYARRVAERLEAAISCGEPTVSAPNSYCRQCRWSPHCEAEWDERDDIGRVAGIRRDHRAALHRAGVRTLAQLAGLGPAELAGVLSPGTARAVTHQARLQLAERTSGEPAYDLLDPAPHLGLGLLPVPDPADVYLDFEGNPWAAGGRGIEYLAGLCDRSGAFVSRWAHDDDAEKRLTERLIDDLLARRRASPGMHVYHYAAYERSALTRMTARYGTREAELDELLRGEALVDLYAVVRQGVRISKPSYSIKKLEAFYWQHTRTAAGSEVGDALSSIVEYERWMLSGERAILDSIEDYNRLDVLSTLALHDWLEERRAELVALGHELTRPSRQSGELAGTDVKPAGEVGRVDQEVVEEELATRLRALGQPLLAACVGWHRREARPAWWEYFRFGGLLTEELVADPKSLGDLGEPEHVGDILDRRGRPSSRIWKYPMPTQDYTGRRGDSLPDVDTLESVGQLHAVDPVAGWVEFRRGVRRGEPPRPRGVGVAGPVRDEELRGSIQRTARALLEGGATMATALLEPAVPSAADLTPRQGESATDVVVRVGRGLDGQVLAVQGPPGTGKTTAAARLIRLLLDDGRSVGVTALSHSVILNLIQAVGRPAWHKTAGDRGGGVIVRLEAQQPQADGADAAAQHPDTQQFKARNCSTPNPTAEAAPSGHSPSKTAELVVEVADNGRVAQGVAAGETRLVGGTAWLWARQEMEASVDVLVIDEAGQFSLANALAVAPAARHGIVLLGDPQQLTQPTQAAHPDGGEVSALEHLLAGHDTIPADRGVFLDRTWRMHPDLAAFVSELSYEERLLSAPGRERQRIDAPAEVTGSGLLWVPCPHEGDSADSDIEAHRVAQITTDLIGGTFSDHEGRVRALTGSDVLVVAPFNAHVARLRDALPDDVRVGTVDKFQGRQAPVVIYSLASSCAELAPRGVSFLYDVHRLNVAISRAQALAVIVGSPALLDAAVATPQQLRAVNALCRYVERARVVEAPIPSVVRIAQAGS
ncbi:MAG: TM0106 family RecB-like putative nuclease, partial [Micrococcales bacterium]|nr:TM0106 family RecB-like putative nuclease [Micrococcales bacterium]